MRIPRKQRGMTMLSWLAIIVIVAVIATAAMKLIPVYMEYYSIVSILDNMQKDKTLKEASKQLLATTFMKRTDINGVTSLKKGDYTIKKVEGKKAYNFRVFYEVRRSLMGNLSIVATFDRSVEIGG